MTGNPYNQYSTRTRMCQYGTCRVEWDFKLSGKGARKYCEEHVKIARKAYQKNWELTRRK
jgi:hypothetical protein